MSFIGLLFKPYIKKNFHESSFICFNFTKYVFVKVFGDMVRYRP